MKVEKIIFTLPTGSFWSNSRKSLKNRCCARPERCVAEKRRRLLFYVASEQFDTSPTSRNALAGGGRSRRVAVVLSDSRRARDARKPDLGSGDGSMAGD